MGSQLGSAHGGLGWVVFSVIQVASKYPLEECPVTTGGGLRFHWPLRGA